jgi:ATP-dependent phosphoenolpyruvate carboxykinase
MNASDDWKPAESIWEMRRKAPFHFLAEAENARVSAYALSHIDEDFASKLTSDAGYSGHIILLSAKPFGVMR